MGRKGSRSKRKPRKQRPKAPTAPQRPPKAHPQKVVKRGRRGRAAIEDLRHALRSVPQVLVCELFNTSRKVLGDWAERGAPRNEDGTYHLGSLLNWRLDELMGIEKADVKSPELERLRRARADMAEMDRAARVGDLISSADVQRGRLERIAAVTRMMDSMARRLPPLLVSLDVKGIQAAIEDECRRVRDEFAREPEPAEHEHGAGHVA